MPSKQGKAGVAECGTVGGKADTSKVNSPGCGQNRQCGNEGEAGAGIRQSPGRFKLDGTWVLKGKLSAGSRNEKNIKASALNTSHRH